MKENIESELSKINTSQAPVVHAYNPSYSGGRDQEDRGSKPPKANSSQQSISKKKKKKPTHQKIRAGGIVNGTGAVCDQNTFKFFMYH
jgi:hypothetical protein